ncbi:MAG: 50S ribosomal protein L24 [Candidatus Micrarchaeota archaeon]
MKSDTERKRFYTEKLHKKKNRLHVHLSKELRSKLKVKKRALLVRKGDTVRIMRGPGKGKEAKIGNVSVVKKLVFLEGIVATTAKGKEVPLAVQPSNILLISLESTPERKQIFSEEAFKKKEIKKPETKPEGTKTGTTSETKTEVKSEETKTPATPVSKSEPPKSETAPKVESTKVR